jgi:hypothetical protein
MTLAHPDPEIPLVLPLHLYDDWVTSKLGTFQKINRANISVAICIDFRDCEFVSPIPILAIATELMTHSALGRKVTINLGSWGSGLKEENKARTRKYLSIHGLLDVFTSNRNLSVRFQYDPTAERGASGHWYGSDAVGESSLKNLKMILERAPVDLLYGNMVVLPATTWQLPHATDPNMSALIRSKVDELLWGADQALFKFKTEARKYRDTTLHRVTQILLELVENAAEHAYRNGSYGFVGIYARVRTGVTAGGEKWRSNELILSPLLSRVVRPDGLHQVEVFVVDVGQGLLADMHYWDGCDEIKSAKYPLRSIQTRLFVEPLSRHSRKKRDVSDLRGLSTGLVHLHEILRREHDTSRIFTLNECIAGAHPGDINYQGTDGATGNFYKGSDHWYGTIFHIGLKPTEIPRLPNPWFESDELTNHDVRSNVLNKIINTDYPATNSVVDIRYGTSIEELRSAVNKVASLSERTVVRFGRVAQKNYINNLVSSWCDSFSLAGVKTPLLYLCDLGRSQAVDTAWVISQYFPKSLKIADKKLRAAIYIVTEDLCCVQLRIEFESTTGHESMTKVSFRELSKDRLPDGIAYVLSSLRQHDSTKLWQRISELNHAQVNPVLIKNVLWTRPNAVGEVLPWYLDFSALVQDRDAARLIRRGLRRMLALFPDANDYALDPIVEASLHDAKKWLVRPTDSTSKRVLVGSLSVSGSTLNRHRSPPGTFITGIIDCIKTPYHSTISNSSKYHVSALLWKADLATTTLQSAEYRRIGSTAYIEPIPSIKKNYKLDENLYSTLEAHRLVKIGHWAYGDRHSLIDINASLAIEQSAVSDTGAVDWLRDRLIESLRHGPICLSFPFNRLAYTLAHTVYEKLPEESKQNVHLLALSFLPRFAGGLTKLAPLTERAAAQIAVTWPDIVPTAIFLDVGFVTSRTLRHTVRQLKQCGFGAVQALGLLNRSSAPMLTSELGSSDLAADVIPTAYWRWNLPIFGTDSHCVLCAALPLIATLRQTILSAHKDLRPYVETVVEHWGAHDVADFWDEHGIAPKVLSSFQISSLTSLFKELESSTPHTTTTLTTKVIELLRLGGDTELPLVIARLMLPHDAETVVELMSCVLLLAASGLSQRDREDYVGILLEAVVACDLLDLGVVDLDRKVRLLELSTLALSIQKTSCRLTVLEELARMLSSHLVQSPQVRVALISFTIDADGTSRVQEAFRHLCNSPDANKILTLNYHALRSERANVPETWHILISVFGQSSSHGQQSAT